MLIFSPMRLALVTGIVMGLAQGWTEVGGGTNFSVHALLSWGGYLYVGGSFTAVDGTALQAQGIARWTGTSWQSIANPGAGGNGKIHVMTVYRGKLIVGGNFTGIGTSSANNLAAYDPVTSTWTSVGGGVNGEVRALYVYDGELLVGGTFTRVGLPPNDQPIALFARWDGTSWKAPDPTNPTYLLTGGNPLAFTEYHGQLYVGGNFTAAYHNETDKAYLTIWDKATQKLLPAYPAGRGPDLPVRTLTVWNDKLYIGGEFQVIGGIASPKLAAFNGVAYEAVPGAPTPGRVQTLLPTPSHLYVGGSFTSVGGQTVNRLACLSANGSWSALRLGLGPTIINALAIHNGLLYAGGNFTQDGAGQALAHIAFFVQPVSLHAPSVPSVSVQYSTPFLIVKAEKTFCGTLVLSNSLGQIVLTQPLCLTSHLSETINLSSLNPGFYFLSLTSQTHTISLNIKIPCLP